MKTACTVLIAFAVGLTSGSAQSQTRVIERTLDSFETAVWKEGAYNRAKGETRLVEDVPAELKGKSRRAMEVRVHYAGTGFQFYGVCPLQTRVPGKLRKVSLWVKPMTPGYSWSLKFKDRDGKEAADGGKLETGLGRTVGKWTRVDFRIPGEWKQPVSISSIASHNWSRKNDKQTASLIVDELRVTTDLAGVDPTNTKLLSIRLGSDMARNVFTRGEEVRLNFTIDSWLGKPLTGQLQWEIRRQGGEVWEDKAAPLSFRDIHQAPLVLNPPELGAHQVELAAKLSTGATVKTSMRFSYIPPPHSYTQAEKEASPYGTNIHGGVPGVSYKALAKTGFTWIRDYAYSLDWLIKSRGDSGLYRGWPWYDRMDAQIQESGLVLLADLMGSIRRPVTVEGKLEPDRAWRADLMHILASFPQYSFWELDNEYDLKHRDEEEARKWSSYAAYHEAFGRIVNLLDEKMLAVEQGNGGIYPERTRDLILRGAFDHIDVANGHFYCGTDAPEVARKNRNVGGEKAAPIQLFDLLREFAAAADADGKDRQAWITEFGWDTLAGHIVPESVQAAYLQRGYLLQLLAGIDKIFWYWNRDTKDEPNNFFDGCGIWDPKDEPKPASAAMAALVHFLKLPEPVGTFDFGENSSGYVFRDRGQLVACAFKVEEDEGEVVAEFTEGELFDMYGNPLPARKQTLTLEPTWAVGISETSPQYLETAYDLKSHLFRQITAGDTPAVELGVRNNRKTPIKAIGRLELPDGWKSDKLELLLEVEPGQAVVVPVPIAVPITEKLGTRKVAITIREGALSKILTTQFQILEPISLPAVKLWHGPGKTTAKAVIENRSLTPRKVSLRATVPASWKIEPADQAVVLAAAKKTEIELQAQWDLNWRPDEVAELTVLSEKGELLARSNLIPRAVRLSRVDSIVCDGKLEDWPAASRLPSWALGATEGIPDADICAGYSERGLFFAFNVRNSKVKVSDPRLFWLQDSIEIFVDTKSDRGARRAFQPTDHQFWLCPLVEENRAYVGRWKRFKEISKTRYDIPEVKSFAERTETGYLIEVLIPSALLEDFVPQKGKRLGLNLNVTVHGRDTKREVFWPGEKGWNVLNMPRFWGMVELD